jgi:serine/threonine protein kinase
MFRIDPYYSSAYFSVFVEYASGGTLTRYIAEQERNEAQAIQFYREIIMAMIYLHDLEILHNDLKCDNILIFKFGGRTISKVADFGHAIYPFPKVTLRGSRSPDRLIGTKKWAPPEFLAVSTPLTKLGPSSDVYTFGFVIACLAAWFDPFALIEDDDEMTRLKGEEGAVLRLLPDEITNEQAWSGELVRGCFEKDPEKRWKRASDMLEANGLVFRQGCPSLDQSLILDRTVDIQQPISPSTGEGAKTKASSFSQFLDEMETITFSTVEETVFHPSGFEANL